MLAPIKYDGSDENEFVKRVQEKINVSLHKGSEND